MFKKRMACRYISSPYRVQNKLSLFGVLHGTTYHFFILIQGRYGKNILYQNYLKTKNTYYLYIFYYKKKWNTIKSQLVSD